MPFGGSVLFRPPGHSRGSGNPGRRGCRHLCVASNWAFGGAKSVSDQYWIKPKANLQLGKFIPMRSFRRLSVSCLVAVLSSYSALAWAKNRPAESVGIAEGNQILVARCGGCHGADARGSDRGPALAEVRRLRTRSVQQLRDII